MEDLKDDAIATALGRHQDELGERILRATPAGVDIGKIVRHSTMPYRETRPEESWYQIAHLLTENKLRNAAISHYLATGVGNRGHLESLAAWGFEANQDAGRNGKDFTRLEYIPE